MGDFSALPPGVRRAKMLENEPALSGGGNRERWTMVGVPVGTLLLVLYAAGPKKFCKLDLYFWGPRRLRAPLRGRGPADSFARVERRHDRHCVGRHCPTIWMSIYVLWAEKRGPYRIRTSENTCFTH